MSIAEVNLGNQEQARGIQGIARAFSQMEQVTQQTAANAEENAAASDKLSAQAQTMRDMLAGLESLVDGARTRERDRL
jgi:methyl-accepting chemotaxis protein